MPAKRVNPNRVRLNRSYSVAELAVCCDVHRNTVRNRRDAGLEPNDGRKPLLFQGATVRTFLAKLNCDRKRPCQPGTMYCLKCRQPREPAPGAIVYRPQRPASGNLSALCGDCGTIMNRSARWADIARILPGRRVQFAQGQASLTGRRSPSPNCDSEPKG